MEPRRRGGGGWGGAGEGEWGGDGGPTVRTLRKNVQDLLTEARRTTQRGLTWETRRMELPSAETGERKGS